MAFQLNHDDVFEANIQDGEYEIFFHKVRENVTQNGAEYIDVDLIIRNDVQQPNQNSHIFHKIWRKKDTGEYNPKSFNYMGKAAGLPHGKVYHNLDSLLQDFVGKTARVRVKNETSEYNGTTYNNLNIKNWDQTKVNGPLRHLTKEKPQTQQQQLTGTDGGFFAPQQINISDDELPF